MEHEERERRGAAIIARLQKQLPVGGLAREAAEIICDSKGAKALVKSLDVYEGRLIDWGAKVHEAERLGRVLLLPLDGNYQDMAHAALFEAVRSGLVQEMAVRTVQAMPTDEAVQFIADHVRALMAAPFAGGHVGAGESSDFLHDLPLPDYWALLTELMPHPAAVALVRDVVSGALRIAPPTDANLQDSYEAFLNNSSYARLDLLRVLHRCGLLDYDLFRAAAFYDPRNATFRNNYNYESSPSRETMREFNARWRRELAENFAIEPGKFAVISNFSYSKGAFFLLKACEHAERLGVKKLLPLEYRECAEVALGRMAHVRDWDEDDNPDEIVARLREFKPATLQMVLPVAGVGQELVLRALDKENLLPLLRLIYTISGYKPQKTQYDYYVYDVQNGSDATSGVLSVPQVRTVLSEVDEADAKMLLGGLRQSRMGFDNTVMLLEAVPGWNRADIEKKLTKRHQTAVKAFGVLLLCENNPEGEALERYLWLRRFVKESKQFGSQRRASEAGAVAVALANLAQVGGYADTTQLEWAMEARLAQGGRQDGPPPRATVGEYEIEVAFVGEEAQMLIRRAGKTIKTPPPTVRAAGEYARLKELQAQLKSQRTRFRATLESMMAEERALSLEEITRLVSLPAARPLLLKLIWTDGTGRIGLFADGFSQLHDAEGQNWKAEGALRLAHPFDLFGAEQLAAWQRFLVKERLVQPFRQAFRELYVLTPAERGTRTFSNRFAGHVVEPRRAARLLGGRGWRLDAVGEFSVPEKAFASAGLRACFNFADVGHFFTETDQITSDAVYFMPLEGPRYWNQRDADPRLPLDSVPPKIFSEVMRDADLVVSVAQLGEGGTLSGEAFERRGDVVRSLVEDLELSGVALDGHFARVSGQLANYRVHLASGVIHIEPGNYLCIVPERSAAREKLFLPFADEDAKMSEVVSKILLLLRDDKIKDETILRQIRAAQKRESA